MNSTISSHALPAETFTSKKFEGAKANKGTVSAKVSGRNITLTLSDDFVTPDTPAPHWQVVDSRGNAHLLQRLVPKSGILHKSITVPSTVPNVTKVQIWCAFAETVLGETAFDRVLGQDDHMSHMSSQFVGVKANKGTVSHKFESGHHVLTLSDDFVVPDAPAPHWQVVDTTGRTYLLNRLVIKGDKYNKVLIVPSNVPDIAKVQIWCAFAEVLLGEATFQEPIL